MKSFYWELAHMSRGAHWWAESSGMGYDCGVDIIMIVYCRDLGFREERVSWHQN